MRMKGRQTIFSVYAVLGVCCTQCMLYLEYAALGVNLWSWHAEIEWDDLILCSAMMVELWTRKREMGDKDADDMEDTSGYEKSGLRLAWLGSEELILLYLDDTLGLVPAVSGMVNWLTYEIIWNPSCSWWFPPYPLVSLSCPQLYPHLRTPS